MPKPPSPDDLVLLSLLAFKDPELERLAQIAPGLRVVQVSRRELAGSEALPQADILLGSAPAEALAAMRARAGRLQWVQIDSAGAAAYADGLPGGVMLTNASGVYGVPAAEHVIALMLALARGLPHALRGMASRRWEPEAEGARRELLGATCCVLGLGDIGREVARRAQGLGMRVVGVRRHAGEPVPGVDRVAAVEELEAVLAEADHVVVTLPGTSATHHLLDTRRLACCKHGACLYNVGRGSVIDEAALIAALRRGHLGGAGLDVFEHEPLPEDSPLWTMANVIVTPHTAGSGPHWYERLMPIFLDNLERFLAGRPLRNVVDREAGY